MLPCRCQPSWLGWQLHANGGADLAGAGLAVALLASSVRALPGGPARVLPWRVVISGKDLAEGLVAFLGKDPAEGRRLQVLILISYIYGLDKDLQATTEVPPEPWSNRSRLGQNLWLKGGSLYWCLGVLPR